MCFRSGSILGYFDYMNSKFLETIWLFHRRRRQIAFSHATQSISAIHQVDCLLARIGISLLLSVTAVPYHIPNPSDADLLLLYVGRRVASSSSNVPHVPSLTRVFSWRPLLAACFGYHNPLLSRFDCRSCVASRTFLRKSWSTG